MPLLDVNVLVALAWDSHVHHAAARAWFLRVSRSEGWSTCSVTECGFVRVSANPKALPLSISVREATAVLGALRAVGKHLFLVDDVSPADPASVSAMNHRDVTDAHLLSVARRHSTRLVTFDSGIATLARGRDLELLRA